jgi:hypothetical protein
VNPETAELHEHMVIIAAIRPGKFRFRWLELAEAQQDGRDELKAAKEGRTLRK